MEIKNGKKIYSVSSGTASSICCFTDNKKSAINSLDSKYKFLIEMTVTSIETINPVTVKYEGS